MHTTDYLIASIGKQLNIPITATSERLGQLIYSAAGQLSLASLWDKSEDDDFISIQHFKQRLAQIFEAYESIIPKTQNVFPRDKSALIDEIYSIYLHNGFFYHASYRLSPVTPTVASNNLISLHRGFSPETMFWMSGLGYYSNKITGDTKSIASMFGLQKCSFEQYLDEVLSYSEWTPIHWPDNSEFLRLDSPFNKGYWQTVPIKDGRISLARFGEPSKLYVLYRYQDGSYHQKTIPQWLFLDCFSGDLNSQGEYRRIANALLKRYGSLPSHKVKANGDLVTVKLGYRLPPSEEAFFKLYSWPILYDFQPKSPQVFTRKMAKPVYEMFRNEMESIGYNFTEE